MGTLVGPEKMTLRVKFYSYADDRPGSVLVGELRWQKGGKIEIVSGAKRLEWIVQSPIMVGKLGALHRVTGESDPEAFMRGLADAYNGHFFASEVIES
jgi:hypothetical protein